jgi:hypothetical protein
LTRVKQYAFLQGSVKIIQLLLDEGAKIFEDSIETYRYEIQTDKILAVMSVVD